MIRKTLLTLALLPLLALSERVLAIGITTMGTSSSTTSFASTGTGFVDDTDVIPTGVDSFSSSTAANPNGLQISIADWSLTNTANQAVFSGNNNIINDGGAATTIARATGIIDVTLSESVNYSFTGDFSGFQRPGSTLSLFASITDLSNSTTIYGESLSSFSDVFTGQSLALDANGVIGTSTGTLAAGTYRFFWNNEIDNGSGGQGLTNFALTLTDLPDNGGGDNGGNHVPDAGSTVMLLSGALTALGGLRKFRICL